MKWFYLRRGKFREHGLVTEEKLHEMARNRELTSDDLLWAESTNDGWVRASSVESLSDELSPEVEEEESAPASGAAVSGVSNIVQEAPQSKSKPVVKIVIAAVVCVGVIAFLMRPKGGDDPPVPVEPEAPVSELPVADQEPVPKEEPLPAARDWTESIEKVDASIDKGDVKRAEKYIAAMAKDDAPSEILADLNGKLKALKQALAKAKIGPLRDALVLGILDDERIGELVDLSIKYDEQSALERALRRMLDDRRSLTIERCVSALKTAKAIKDQKLMRLAGDRYLHVMPKNATYAGCSRIVALLVEHNLVNEAMSIVEQCLEKSPEDASAWLELAALQSMEGKSKKALASLRYAVKFGGIQIKRKALFDTRFDSIRDEKLFRRYTEGS